MKEILIGINSLFKEIYNGLFMTLPHWAQNFLNLFFWSLLMVIYAIFIWKFYRWIARKDILKLNLSRFNISNNVILSKIIGGAIYFLEYIIILPFVIFLWFGVFTIFLIFLTKTLELKTILVIAVTIVVAIRMTAYYKEDLARDLAKMIPLTLLAVAITQGIFNIGKVINQIQIIPNFFSDIWIYLLFIVIVEFFLRVVDVIFISFKLYEKKEIESPDSESD